MVGGQDGGEGVRLLLRYGVSNCNAKWVGDVSINELGTPTKIVLNLKEYNTHLQKCICINRAYKTKSRGHRPDPFECGRWFFSVIFERNNTLTLFQIYFTTFQLQKNQPCTREKSTLMFLKLVFWGGGIPLDRRARFFSFGVEHEMLDIFLYRFFRKKYFKKNLYSKQVNS